MTQKVASYFKFNPTGAFSVDWYIGKRCNFACSYCVDYLHDNYSKHVPLENMKALADSIIDKHGHNVFWSLTGGEPTINPKFMDLCKYIKHERGARHISITTNGTRTADYMIQLFEYIDNITLSFHFEYLDGRIDEYIEKCIKIDKWRREWNEQQQATGKMFPNWDEGYVQKNLILRFMVYPDKLETIERMEKAFRDAGITNIEHRYIRKPSGKTSNELMPSKKLDFEQNHDEMNKEEVGTGNIVPSKKADLKKLEDPLLPEAMAQSPTTEAGKQEVFDREANFYADDELTKIKELYVSKADPSKRKLKFWFTDDDGKYFDEDYHYNELNFDKKNNYQGWLCWAGVKHLKVTPTGDIYIGSCHVGGKRGNIYDSGSVDLPKEPIRCPKWRCTDNLDLKVPKIKDMEHYHLIKDMVEWEDDRTK